MIIDFPETFNKVGPALVRTGNWDPSKTFITDGLIDSARSPDAAGEDVVEGLRGTAPGTPDDGRGVEAFDKPVHDGRAEGRRSGRRSMLRTSTP